MAFREPIARGARDTYKGAVCDKHFLEERNKVEEDRGWKDAYGPGFA